jgi:cell division protein ZapD
VSTPFQGSAVILYEYPFNERIRTYLRLEHLFSRLGELLGRQGATDHHFAILTIFEIMEVGGRAELKTDVLKDLEKQKHQLNSYRGNPAISEAALDQVVGQLDGRFAALNELHGKIGQPLTDVDWLMSLRSRASIPGGTCEFDLPAYHAWQHLDADRRRADLQRWIGWLLPLAESVTMLLKLVRDAGAPQKVMSTQGHFQQSLPSGRSFQLLRLRIDPQLGLIPEISANRLMVSVRFVRFGDTQRLQSVTDDAQFELSYCS